jgi:N-acetylneuraminic acid mutarotase
MNAVRLTALGFVFLTACGSPSARPTAGPSPSPSPTRETLCQPFPDRLIDDFIAAWGDRDLDALSDLVEVDGIHDLGALPSAGQADFESLADWAEAAWSAGDQLELTAYGAFVGSRDGFTMYVLRRNDALREAGITEVAMFLHGRSTGCTIDELGSIGPVQARGDPCAFYDAFRAHPSVDAEEPPPCADGSGAFARLGHTAVWTDRAMLVLGGIRGSDFWPQDRWETGLRFSPGGSWRETDDLPVPARSLSGTAWTRTEVITWGGGDTAPAAYDPDEDRWRLIAEPPLPDADRPPGVWTGSRLILWGSTQYSEDPHRFGAAYDPATGSWERIPAAPIAGRSGHTAVWTGSEMIVWGGTNYRTDLGDGAAYDPVTRTWQPITDAPIASRTDHSAVWTGEEMLIFGGSSISRGMANGAAYNPESDTWRRIPDLPLAGRHRHVAVWTGDELIVWGGYDYHRALGNGAAYDPASDRWRILAEAPISPRCDHSGVWTGREMIVFGGTDGCGSGGRIPFGDGAAYDPASDSWRRLNPAI